MFDTINMAVLWTFFHSVRSIKNNSGWSGGGGLELDFAVAAAGAEPGDEADVAGEHDGGENRDAAEGGLVVRGADVFDFGLFGRGEGGDFCFVEGTIGEAVFGLGGFGDFLMKGGILLREVFVK